MSPPPRFFLEIADDPRAGGKARSLARLRAAGLPTPDGFVVADALFRALARSTPPATADLATAPFPAGFEAQLDQRLAALGGAAAFSVRSSFAAEDAPDRIAAGIYQSRVGIAAAGVAAAVREVLASALAPAAAAYAAALGRAVAEPPVAVLVHRHQPGELSGGAAFDPTRPDSFVVDAPGAAVPPAVRARLSAALAGLARQHGASEIEWVADAGGAVTFLQLRPYRAPAPAAPWPGLSELPAGEHWSWDAAHNPLPLSAAQAGLVALVDQRCRIGFRQRVVRGYLFWAPGGAPPQTAIRPSAIALAMSALAADVDRALAPLGDPPPLEAALDAFCVFYERIYGVLRPAIQEARAALAQALQQPPSGAELLPLLLAGVTSRATERHRLADRIARASDARARQTAIDDYLAVFGDESAVWDLSAPTHRERPDSLAPAPAAAPALAPAAPSWRPALDRLRAARAPDEAAALEQRVLDARAAVAAGEDDDWLYARLQAAVRRALIAIGDRMHTAGELDRRDDVFHLPLEAVRAHAAGHPWPRPPRALAAEGRAAYQAALRDSPPLLPAGLPTGPVRGSGTGGRTVGRIHWHDPARPGPPDAVLLATTMLPTELPLLRAAALITETGGPLDHVATQARERHLPAVVGAAHARARLPEGTLVLVDADAGLILSLPEPL